MPSLLERLLGAVPGSARLPEIPAPEIVLDPQKVGEFERFAAESIDTGLRDAVYDLPYAKHEFVRWLAGSRPVLFHGSPGPRKDNLLPQRATGVDNAGRQLGVYASPWPLWSMWFAVLSKRFPPFVYTVNGSRAIHPADFGERKYWFKVNPGARSTRVLTDGYLYVLPSDRFAECPPSRFGPVRQPGEPSEQWVCMQAVEPILAMPVTPADFPFTSLVLRE